MLDAGYDRPAAQPEDDILQPSTSDQGYVPADRYNTAKKFLLG